MHEKSWLHAYIYNVFVHKNLPVKYSLMSTSDGSFSMGVREYVNTGKAGGISTTSSTVDHLVKLIMISFSIGLYILFTFFIWIKEIL
jgi:hypothetical protein